MKKKLYFYTALVLIPAAFVFAIWAGSYTNFYIGVLTWLIITLIASKIMRSIKS